MLIEVDKKEGRARCTFIVEAKGRQEGRKRWLLIEVEEEEG